MVLEKIPDSPLDNKEVKPVSLKRNQLWILIQRTDAKAEAPLFWSSDANRWLTVNTSDAGKDWGQKEKSVVRGWDNLMASPKQWTWTWANFRRWQGTGRLGVLRVWDPKESDTTGQPNDNIMMPGWASVQTRMKPQRWNHFTLPVKSFTQLRQTVCPAGLQPADLS